MRQVIAFPTSRCQEIICLHVLPAYKTPGEDLVGYDFSTATEPEGQTIENRFQPQLATNRIQPAPSTVETIDIRNRFSSLDWSSSRLFRHAKTELQIGTALLKLDLQPAEINPALRRIVGVDTSDHG